MSAWTRKIAAEDPERYRAWLDKRNAAHKPRTEEQKAAQREHYKARGKKRKSLPKGRRFYPEGFSSFRIPEEDLAAWYRARDKWL